MACAGRTAVDPAQGGVDRFERTGRVGVGRRAADRPVPCLRGARAPTPAIWPSTARGRGSTEGIGCPGRAAGLPTRAPKTDRARPTGLHRERIGQRAPVELETRLRRLADLWVRADVGRARRPRQRSGVQVLAGRATCGPGCACPLRAVPTVMPSSVRRRRPMLDCRFDSGRIGGGLSSTVRCAPSPDTYRSHPWSATDWNGSSGGARWRRCLQ